MNSEELKRIEQLKHFEVLLGNCIGYLWEIWNNESCEEIKRGFERLGFKEEDLNYWEINEDLKNLEEDNKCPWERY